MTATDRALELARAAAAAAADKLADHDHRHRRAATSSRSPTPSCSCSAIQRAPGRRIVDEVEDRLRELGAKPVRREGERDGRWVLIDYGDIVVHVQHEEEREFYALERLWKDCPEIDLRRSRLRPPVPRRSMSRPPCRRPGGAASRRRAAARPRPIDNAARVWQGHQDTELSDRGREQAAGRGAAPRGLRAGAHRLVRPRARAASTAEPSPG